MALCKMVEKGHPILNIKLEGVSKDLDRNQTVEDLVETMTHEGGIGVSANQLGLMERVFVMYSDFKEKKIIACFDPQIIEYADEDVLMTEGCLTYPGLWLKVKRPVLEARIFQHEYDHMEGTNFTNQVSKMKLSMAKKRLQKVTKKVDKLKSA
jgi:peptide deformylase